MPVASTAKAATSMIPATMPEVVRTSVKPNKPTLSDSRYPTRVPIENAAPDAYASRCPVNGNRDGQQVGRDDLQQKQRPDRRNRVVPGQVQVEMNGS